MTDKPIPDIGTVVGTPGQRPQVTPAEVVRAVDKLIMDHLGVDKLEPGDRFLQELRADSLDVVELVMLAEDHFHIEISDDEAEKIVTVSDTYELIERKVNGRG